MFCTNCGNKMADGTSFCSKCGKPMKPASVPQQGSGYSANIPQGSVNTPQSPIHQPVNVGQTPQTTGYSPQGVGQTSQVPRYQPQNMGSTSQAPSQTIPGAGYQPQNPGYSPQSFGNSQQNTGYSPQRPGYSPPGGGYSPPSNPYSPPAGGYYPPGQPGGKKSKKPIWIALGIALGVILIIILSVLWANSLTPPVNTTDDPSTTVPVTDTDLAADGFRNNYTTILGSGADTYTIMIYICGSDLESDGGFATADIQEMVAADFGDNVNVVIETGGASSWSTPGMSGVQRWTIENGQLIKLQDIGQMAMLSASALSDFINYSTNTYPANRYGLIFWDHGGGSLYGFGYDELYPDTCLYLPDIADALSYSGVKFDFVGFDACLMGSIETAYMLEPYADYMIGSEETEPAYGWYYTPWLTTLGRNTSIGTVELGTQIVDSFIYQNGDDSTLSVVALREIPYVYEVLCEYMSNATSSMTSKDFNIISAAVSNTKSFAEGDYDLIDIVDFTNQSEISGEQDLIAALSSAVKYRNDCTRFGIYGLSLYFPYSDISVYGYAKDMFAEIGFGGPVYEFYDTFVNILAGGQTYSGGRSLQENISGEDAAPADYSDYDWYDDTAVDDYSYDSIDYTALEIFCDEANGYYYLPLTGEDWDLITTVEMQILLDDGYGYIDLGSDQYYETDDYGNLILNYGAENTWIAIDGQIVSYYAEETIETEDDYIFTGYVPALLNGETYIEIMLQWDGATADGYIAGYRVTESNSAIGGAGTIGKGYKQFVQGDAIDFICDYYTYEGDFDASYYFGETMVIGSEIPAVTYEDVGDDPVLECYMIVDIYQNYSWTEYVEFSY